MNFARMLSRNVRILSRRQHDAAIAALKQVDMKEERRERERGGVWNRLRTRIDDKLNQF